MMSVYIVILSFFFFFNDTATTEIYTLSLHDALPICLRPGAHAGGTCDEGPRPLTSPRTTLRNPWGRSEEHTSELQSQFHLVCRLLLEKKNKTRKYIHIHHTPLVLDQIRSDHAV